VKPLRVCIDARVTPGEAGGIEQFVLSVGRGLLGLRDGDEEYVFLVYDESVAWAREHFGPGARLLRVSRRGARGPWSALRRAVMHSVPKRLGLPTRREVRRSDGTIERAGIDLMHFTFQKAFLTIVPTIYQPHDLQHLHLPELFAERVRRDRETTWPIFCRSAAAVAVVSTWVKEDVQKQYGIDPSRIFVVPYSPPVAAYAAPTPDDLERARAKLALPPRFVFYPAQTWPHKNHLGLVEAVALLRAEGVDVPVVFSGRRNDFHAVIQQRIDELGLGGQIRFLDFISTGELRCVYRLATAVVIPSRFEAASYPLWEAFAEEVPAACSNVTSLPRQAGDAALLFDPADAGAIAAAVRSLWTDADLRARLIERGRANVAQFTADRSARAFRALYRHVGGRALCEADRELLYAPPLM
jgi:glycosyltransferase involved in cell wall biosynthesis